MTISVIFASRNRAALLTQTLDSFTKLQVVGFDWEILAVDNGSTDSTGQVLQRYASRLPLRPIEEPQPGKNRALNRALPLARGELLVFTDDDVVPHVDWLSALVRATQRWPDDTIFGGRIVALFPPETPDWLRTHQYAGAAYAEFTPDDPEGPILRAPFGANYAVRARALATQRFSSDLGPKVGSYAVGGETELLMRLMRLGHRVIYVPDAEVGHVVRDEQLQMPWIFRRAHGQGRGNMRLAHMFSLPTLPVRSLYWRLLTTGLSYYAQVAFARRDTRRIFERGTVYHYWRGQIHECRRIAHQQDQRPEAGN